MSYLGGLRKFEGRVDNLLVTFHPNYTMVGKFVSYFRDVFITTYQMDDSKLNDYTLHNEKR